MPILPRTAYKKMPEHPGVYLMRDKKRKLLYVGKAVNLRRRVTSYFTRPLDARISQMVAQVKNVEYRGTDTAIEALILESQLIKKYHPPYNIREKDDKSFLHVIITKEDFPRVLLLRGKELEEPHTNYKSYTSYKTYMIQKSYGPFTSGSAIREALRILRKIFPYSVHASLDANMRMSTNDTNINRNRNVVISTKRLAISKPRPCFDYQLGLCPGTCMGAISKSDYRKIIRDLRDFFEGRKLRIVKRYEIEMKLAAKKLEFEHAATLRKKIFALKHIQDVSVIRSDANILIDANNTNKTHFRIEGYDISNISGTSAVGSMVVFVDGEAAKGEYRKFKIKTVVGSNDPAMLTEVLRRRFGHPEWTRPDLILVDGGAPQVSAAKSILRELGVKIPLLGIAKGPERKRNDFFGLIPEGVSRNTLIQVRDESHRFAIQYHRKVRGQRAFD